MNILITGTSSGIGYGLALEFLKKGNAVFGVSRRPSEQLLEYEGYKHLQIDLTDFAKVESEIPQFIANIKQIDLVILNAGVLGEINFMGKIDVKAMKEVMEINVWANKVVLDSLLGSSVKLKQVIGLSTKASIRSSPGWGSYAVSKAALNMLMNVYAKEYEELHFTAFAPGLVDSEIQEYIWNIRDSDKFPAAKRIQSARYTETMPDAISAAPKLIKGIEKCLEFESGGFVDVRDLNLE